MSTARKGTCTYKCFPKRQTFHNAPLISLTELKKICDYFYAFFRQHFREITLLNSLRQSCHGYTSSLHCSTCSNISSSYCRFASRYSSRVPVRICSSSFFITSNQGQPTACWKARRYRNDNESKTMQYGRRDKNVPPTNAAVARSLWQNRNKKQKA